MRDRLLIANGQGFWGDSILGPVRLVREGPIHYLALDYLAEVTMSIMQKLRSRNPQMGYATDFLKLLDRILPEAHHKGIKIVANAGGVNPRACLAAVLELARKKGCKGLKVGIIEGDDILPRIDELLAGGEPLRNMDDGRPLGAIRDHLEQQLGSDLGQRHVAELVDADQLDALPTPQGPAQGVGGAGFDQLVDQGCGGGEAYPSALLAGRHAQARSQVRLAGSGLAQQQDRLSTGDVTAPGEIGDAHRRYR